MKKLHLGFDSRSALSPFPSLTYMFHIIFHWIRVAGFIVVFGLGYHVEIPSNVLDGSPSTDLPTDDFIGSLTSIPDNIPVSSPLRRYINGLRETSNDFIFLVLVNTFQLYLELQSFSSGNIYGYYMAIVLMIHNAVLTMFIPSTTSLPVTRDYWITFSIISGASVLEALITIYTTYLRRFESRLIVFRKVGANPRINAAFSTRTILQTFGSINVFFALNLGLKDLILPSSRFNKPSIPRYIYVLLTFVQQLFISVNFYSEDKIQRRIALYISYLRIPLIIGAIVWLAIAPPPRIGLTDDVEIFVLSDILAISIIMIWFLESDTRMFGSGLKEYMMFKTNKLDLSS